MGTDLGPVSLRLAFVTRPDGGTCRDEIARAVVGVEARAVHERQPTFRGSLGEARRFKMTHYLISENYDP